MTPLNIKGKIQDKLKIKSLKYKTLCKFQFNLKLKVSMMNIFLKYRNTTIFPLTLFYNP